MVVRGLRRALGRLGYTIVRVPQDAAPSDSFYRPSSTCQIPTLAFLYRWFLGERGTGTFVEVGAFDGESYSNTSCLADRGWRGLYVEPVPEFAERCRVRHARNPHVTVINAAVGAETGEAAIAVGGPLSTARPALVAEYRQIAWAQPSFVDSTTVRVQQITLDRLLEDHHIAPRFDVLSVDVEGCETEVFAGFDLERWRPRVMLVELADTHSELASTRTEHARLSTRITAAGYRIVYKDAINTMFVEHAAFDASYECGSGG